VDFAGDGVAKHACILRTDQEDVAKSRRDFGILDMLDLGGGRTAFFLPRGVMRRPQVAGKLQQLGEIRSVEPGQIGVAAVIRQVVPGNPETSVSRLVSPRAPLRRGCGTRTLSVDGETKQTLRITLLNRCW
jgi:hypothetical protein